MAEKVPTAYDVLKIVEKKLNCSICLQNFTQPKSLPCLHVFCKDCLGLLPHLRQGDGYVVKCPICRSPAPVPQDGISGFPDQFHFNDYADMQQMLKKMAENQQVTCGACNKNHAQGFCQQCERFFCQECIDAHRKMEGLFAGHEIMSINEVLIAASQFKPIKKPSILQCSKHERPLTVYCHSPCDKLICHDCTIRDHRDHECDPISDKSVFMKYKQEIDDSLLPTKQRLTFIFRKIEAFNKTMLAIVENRDRVKKEIQAIGDQMIAEYSAAVRQSISQLEEKADTGAEKKLRFMCARKEDAQTTAAILQSCVEYVERELRMSSKQQILASKTQMVERMKVITSQVKEEKYSLTESPDIKIFKSMGKNANVGDVEFSMLVNKCKVSGEGITTATRRESSGFQIVIISTPGSTPLSLPISLISCQLSTPEATCLTDCNITETTPGKYEVRYTPVTSGPHQLRVRVGDVDIPGSPFTVQVKMGGTPLHTTGGLSRPWGVAVSKDGSVVITENGNHRVTVLDKEGKKIKSFGSEGKNSAHFKSPKGVVITHDNKIFISDGENHRIQKFDREGRFLAAVGSLGNGHQQFKHPAGITADKNNKILVADSGNCRIQVLNSDLTFSHTFEVAESQSGQFQHPRSISTDSRGMVYVIDSTNHQVQKFTPEGVFVAQFGKEGRGEGELMYPHGIAIDTTTDTVYVSSNHKVSAFTTNGKFLDEFGRQGSGEREFVYPYGLAFNESTGDLYVCDGYNNRLVVY